MTKLEEHIAKPTTDGGTNTPGLGDIPDRTALLEGAVSDLQTVVEANHPGELTGEPLSSSEGKFVALDTAYLDGVRQSVLFSSKDGKRFNQMGVSITGAHLSLDIGNMCFDVSDDVVVVADKNSLVHITRDGGETWSSSNVAENHPNYANGFDATTVLTDHNGNWFLGYDNGIAYMSYDNANTWVEQPYKLNSMVSDSEDFQDASCDGKGTWIVAYTNNLCISRDNGVTWEEITGPQQTVDGVGVSSINSVEWVKEDLWFIGGISVSSNHYYSNDGCRTFNVIGRFDVIGSNGSAGTYGVIPVNGAVLQLASGVVSYYYNSLTRKQNNNNFFGLTNIGAFRYGDTNHTGTVVAVNTTLSIISTDNANTFSCSAFNGLTSPSHIRYNKDPRMSVVVPEGDGAV